MDIDFIYILNIIGLIAFSVSGAFKGMKYHLDVLGVIVLGVMTALGGGILRDVLMNSRPASLVNETDMYFAISIAVIAYILGRRVQNYVTIIKIFDAAGLAVFTVMGAEKGISGGLGAIGVIIMGTLTGVAGGVIRDLFVNEVPFILKEEVYAMFCIIGSFLLWILLKFSDIDRNIAIYIVISIIFIGRINAIKFDWHLPKRKI